MQLRPLIELRKCAGLTQAQLAFRMHMSRPAYCKLESGQTNITYLQLTRLAVALKLSMSQLFTSPDPTGPHAEADFMRQSLESLIFSRLAAAESVHQEPIPFEELMDYDWDWLRLNGIHTREEYNSNPTLVMRTSSAGSALAFAEVVQDMDLYSWFHHGLIKHTVLLARWKAHQAAYEPYFSFEKSPFGRVIVRDLRQDAAPASAANAKPAGGPELDQLQGVPEEFWQIIQQDSDARHVAYCLHHAVHEDAGHEEYAALRAALRNDPAAYNRTLLRLLGLIWTLPHLGADDVVFEEERRLQNEGREETDAVYAEAAARWPRWD